MRDFFQHPDSSVDPSSTIGAGCSIWAWSQVREGVTVGSETTIGQGVYIGPGARIGNRCKIQNQALIYEPSELEDGVFVGPGVIFTNDKFPRSVNLNGTSKTSDDWRPVGSYVETGASIGARAVIVAPVRLGRWSMVAAGAVVSSDVAPFSLVAGTPATHKGWVGHSGRRLAVNGDHFVCPDTGEIYREVGGELRWNYE